MVFNRFKPDSQPPWVDLLEGVTGVDDSGGEVNNTKKPRELKPGESSRVGTPSARPEARRPRKPAPKAKAAGLGKPATTTYQPKYFTKEQMRQESAGRQFDADGKPLVGRYPDGSMPEPNQRAYGIAQIQEGTARETAKRHGIKWDRNRFYSDPDYNLMLGDKHMGDLTRRYKDPQIAKLAYHQGTGNVDAALKDPKVVSGQIPYWESRHIGPLGRQYIGKGGSGQQDSRSAAAQGTGRMTGGVNQYDYSEISVKDPTLTVATQAEKDAIKAPAKFEVVNPFELGAKVRTVVDKIESQATPLADAITTAINQANALQEEDLREVENRNAQKAAIRKTTMDNNLAAVAEAAPILQQRKVIRDRKGEIAAMNPFERMIKGTFDPGYNYDWLESRDRILEEQLSDINEGYKFTTGLLNDQAGMFDSAFKDQQDVRTTKRNSVNEDILLLNQQLTLSRTILDDLSSALTFDNSIEAAKLFKRESIVANLTLPQVNEIVNTATGPTVMVNGIEIPVQMLIDRQEKAKEHEYARAVQKSAIQSGNNRLLEQADARLIGTMTQEQIQEALNNGGVYDGRQLDVPTLMAANENYEAVKQKNAANQLAESGVARTYEYMTGWTQHMEQVTNRFQNLGLGGFEPLTALTQESNSLMRDYVDGLDAARAGGYLPQYQEAFDKQFADLNDRQNKLLTDAANQWGGGNKERAAFAYSFLTGGTVDPGVAAQVLVDASENGLPAGSITNQSISKAFAVGDAAVAAFDAQNPNTPLTMIQGADSKAVKAERDKVRIDAVVNYYVADATEYGYSLGWAAGTESNPDNPSLAIPVTPFAKAMTAEAWASHRQAAEMGGYDGLGKELGVSSQEAVVLRGDRKKYEAWQLESGSEISYDQAIEIFNAEEAISLFGILDASYSDIGGLRPSAAYIQMLNSPEHQQVVLSQIGIIPRGDVGHFIVRGVAGDKPQRAYLGLVADQTRYFQTYESTRQNALGQSVLATGGDPMQLSKVVLSSYPGVKPEDQAYFMQNAFPRRTQTTARGNEFPKPYSQQEIDQIILHGKFDDPRLEAIRKQIAPDWADRTRSMTEAAKQR